MLGSLSNLQSLFSGKAETPSREPIREAEPSQKAEAFASAPEAPEAIPQQKADSEHALNALDRLQCIVSFMPDGTILGANQNFLAASGYREEEITGRPYSIFWLPDAYSEAAYEAFWSELRSGKTIDRELRWMGANGRELWLQSVYCPLPDVAGKVEKIVKYSGDISSRKRLEQEVERALEAAHANEERSRHAQETLEVRTQQMQANHQELIRALDELNTRQKWEVRLAKLSERLRWQHGEDLETWANGVFDFLAEDNHILQASLYQGGAHNGSLRYIAGYGNPANLRTEIALGEGLVGQTAKNAFPTWLEERHLRQSNCVTGMYNLQPSALLIHPLTNNNLVEGVMEIALAEEPTPELRNFLSQFGSMLAAALSYVSNQRQIQELLEEAESKNQALTQQEEELREALGQLRSAQGQMESYQTELERVNAGLEQSVAERTKELESAMQEVKSAHNQLVLSEKMAVLGQLVAGVAHEMNTPLGAIKAAAVNILDVMQPLTDDAVCLLPTLGSEAGELIRRFSEKVLANTDVVSSREQRQLRRNYTSLLEEAGIQNAEDMARMIVEAGFRSELAEFLPLLHHPRAMEVAQFLARQGQMLHNVRNIDLAAEKTKKVVFALKSYTHTRQGETAERAQLPLLLDTVLAIYHNQLKYGVEVMTEYEEISDVLCWPDELSQVWTNLISNAVQAMEGRGTLKVSVYGKDGKAVVAIEDSGPGIPPEIQARIFEPFFTTKDRGQGTGLGLDICHKIIEKHSGKMYFESQPGRTCFFVELPFAE